MESIRDLSKNESIFYTNQNGDIIYNKICELCANECKQSFQSRLIACHNNILVKSKEDYLHEIKKQNKTIKDVAHSIKINTKTLTSFLTNYNKDIDYEVHKKLMLELFGENIDDNNKQKQVKKK